MNTVQKYFKGNRIKSDLDAIECKSLLWELRQNCNEAYLEIFTEVENTLDISDILTGAINMEYAAMMIDTDCAITREVNVYIDTILEEIEDLESEDYINAQNELGDAIYCDNKERARSID